MDKYIIINSNENLENKLFRVQKKTNLILRPGPKCLCIKPKLKTNYNISKKGAKFIRSQYYELPIASDHQDLISSSLNWQANLTLETAGTFHFVCLSAEGNQIWQAYVLVEPDIKIPLDAIKCQTILAKNLGPLDQWRKRLELCKELEYNMIHFTPVQDLGSSNSAYAIKNQHKLNPLFKANLDDVKKEVEFINKKWHMLSVTDIVLNHTADDSQWIHDHPECAYNCSNSPHLRPAFLLDSAVVWLLQDLMKGLLKNTDGLDLNIRTEGDVRHIGVLLKTFYVPSMKIWELFMVDATNTIKNIKNIALGQELIIDYNQYTRYGATVKCMPSSVSSPEQLIDLLKAKNIATKKMIDSYIDQAINNAMSAIRWERLNPSGPYYGRPLSEEAPLVAPYFTHTPIDNFKIADEEKKMYQSGQQFMAHNGWVMGCAGRLDFCSPESNVFLKRELIAWGDCIKLRYGSDPKDVPFLWDHMKKYVEAQAKIFHGFRIDNCHSTPLHVAEYFIDLARTIRPDIYIMAELFTSSESEDNIYVNHLGITALIRESMSANNARELGRLMYRFGGTPVGAFHQPGAELLRPSVARAFFYDQTHDNESPIVRRSAHDVPATTALINMAMCATGSNRGYDELVPHHINVVTEERLYPDNWNLNSGIMPLRRILNGDLQNELSQGFSEIFVDQLNDDIIAITRLNPLDGRTIVLVARTAFSKTFNVCSSETIKIQGKVQRMLFEAQAVGNPDDYKRNDSIINGLESFKVEILSKFKDLDQANNTSSKCHLATIFNHEDDRAEIVLVDYQPGAVFAVEIALSKRQTEALKFLNQWDIDLSKMNLSLDDANHILFRIPQEDELDPYELPGFAKFTYLGLYGLMYYLEKVRENQDQAHPLAMNLRQGNWLSQYIVSRLRKRETTSKLANHLDEALKNVDLLPRGMVPKYFDMVITKLYNTLVEMVYSKMSPFISKGPKLVKLLALSSVALVGECETAPMPSIDSKTKILSIAAGLPHFASGYMRNWGRDTFIALRGLLLITGRFSDAKHVILSYARTLKNGLIPNLLDGGSKSRYNCRDAVWWWLYSIREYTKIVPNGVEILKCRVSRIHKPASNVPQRKRSVAQTNGYGDSSSQQLCDIIQEALECHFRGVEFIEENAGKQLDEHMLEEGFKVTFGVDRQTGFVFGGNRYNCGTWMDKMGSSEKAKTKGLPASPRDGSAVEIIGLCKAVVSWLHDMSSRNTRAYPYDGVECLYDNTITLKWTWSKWATMIQSNFEKYFYIPTENGNVEKHAEIKTELVNRRGIYKDSVGATLEWQDYQLRPNFLVAMTVAPELFDRKHAKHALGVVKKHLCGPLGMKTLDPTDWNYYGTYDNGDDSNDPKVAHGYNYHQGPEWLWLTGYYIRACSKFVGAQTVEQFANFYATLIESPWLGLPELTNADGKVCPGSCPIQAWSLGTALEALHESVK